MYTMNTSFNKQTNKTVYRGWTPLIYKIKGNKWNMAQVTAEGERQRVIDKSTNRHGAAYQAVRHRVVLARKSPAAAGMKDPR